MPQSVFHFMGQMVWYHFHNSLFFVAWYYLVRSCFNEHELILSLGLTISQHWAHKSAWAQWRPNDAFYGDWILDETMQFFFVLNNQKIKMQFDCHLIILQLWWETRRRLKTSWWLRLVTIWWGIKKNNLCIIGSEYTELYALLSNNKCSHMC